MEAGERDCSFLAEIFYALSMQGAVSGALLHTTFVR